MLAPSDLVSALEEHWPPLRLVVTCDDCGAELWDSKKKNLGASPVKNSAPYVASWIHAEMGQHQSDTGDHDDYSIDLVEQPTAKKLDVDVEVTVSG